MEPNVSPTVAAGPATLSDTDLAPGTVVGEYVVEGKLGEGGFGAVFRASHPLIGKVVAIKVLGKRFSADRDMVSRFQAEARAVNQIRHRNIIDIFSFGHLDDGRCYYIMELLDGETLDGRVRRQKRIPLGETIPILRSIARALDAAHEKGIAHRDLKAENVFLATDADGSVFPKLLDFGIAKLMGPDDGVIHKTRTGAPMGTPYYMSPEQCRGRNVDARTDHYAFGVLAYVMLTGKFPIDAEDYMTILMRQVTDDPEPPSTHVPGLPEGVDRTVAWLMAKEPALRPPNLVTAVRAFEEAAGMQAPVSAELAATVEPGVLARIPTAITAKPAGRVPADAATATTLPPTVPPTVAIEPPPRSRGLAIGIAIAAIAIAAAVIIFVMSRGDGDKPAAVPDATVAAKAPPPAPDAAPKIEIDAAVQASVDAAPVATTVTLTFDGAPPKTEVRIGGKLFGTVPKVVVPKGELEAILVLSADGFETKSVPFTPDKDQPLTVTLVKKGGVKPPPVVKTGSGSAKPPTPTPGSGTDEPTNDIDTPQFHKKPNP